MPDVEQVQFTKARPKKKERQPWGSSEVLTSGPGFQTVRLTISPLKRLPTMWHRHRDEQWVIARGTAKVLVDSKEQTFGRGQTVNIPRTVEHSAENISSVDPLEIIEVQTGDYIGGDDVVEVEDSGQ